MQDAVEAGTPIDEATGDDMEYLGIKKEENPVLKLEITICDGGVQDVVKIGGPANIDFEYDLVKLDTHE